jgi:hypothetical protein
METKNMSVPYSVVHAASYDEVESTLAPPAVTSPRKESKGMVSIFESMIVTVSSVATDLFENGGVIQNRSRNSTAVICPR